MKTAAVPAIFLTCLSLSSPLRAALVPTAAGDIILSFDATGGQGADTNLEVNLGPASNFYNAAAGSATVLTNLSVQDLKDTFGEDWATRSDLFWGLAGTTGLGAVGTAPAKTVWASRAEVTAGTASIPWPRAGAFTLQVPAQTIQSLYTGAPGSLGNANATANSAFSGKVDASLGGSWTVQETFTAGVSFRYFNPSVMNGVNTFSATGSAYDGTAYTVLDLYDVRPGTPGDPAVRLGGIGINSAGKLVFSTDVTKFAPPSTNVVLGEPTLTLNANGSSTVSLTSVPNGTYALDRSTTLAAGSWATLFTQSPVSGTLIYNDPTPPAGRGFYRIRKTP